MRRIVLLEELCNAHHPARRAEVLQQLSVGQHAGSSSQGPNGGSNFLLAVPDDWQAGAWPAGAVS
jgi:hypothetical protein